MLSRQLRAASRPAARSAVGLSACPTARLTARPTTSCISQISRCGRDERRYATLDHRNRWSNVWTPAPKVKLADAKRNEESHAKLVRAGFFRQAHAGVFHMLPLGLRVQDKIEAIVDKHMRAIGCSRVSLSTISSEKLWAKSGRLDGVQGELFHFADRKKARYLLSPTHEEEITELVATNIKSYRDLPLRLYQITRKYRDEMRPRHGILRSREFVMKDLYSFDATVDDAMATYEQVRGAYARIFAELRVPVLAARASSGDMGGDMSHEYHLPASLGEDHVAHCTACGSTANLEVLTAPVPGGEDTEQAKRFAASNIRSVEAWRGITKDRQTLVNVWYPSVVEEEEEAADGTTTTTTTTLTDDDVDIYAIKAVVPELDASIEDVPSAWHRTLVAAQETESPEQTQTQPRIINLVDWRLRSVLDSNAGMIDPLSWPFHRAVPSKAVIQDVFSVGEPVAMPSALAKPETETPGFNFLKVRSGDDCLDCGAAGALVVHRAIELGHTFYLGTRYTGPDALAVEVAANTSTSKQHKLTPVMGCYGLGISRILGAVADHLADARGLVWPRAIAPYEVVVVADGKTATVAEGIYDELTRPGIDTDGPGINPDEALLDDRANMALAYKLKDTDVVGYPVVVVVGKAWRTSTAGVDVDHQAGDALPRHGVVEVQCRQLGVKQDVEVQALRSFVGDLLKRV